MFLLHWVNACIEKSIVTWHGAIVTVYLLQTCKQTVFCNILSSREFLPLIRSRPFLLHIYSGQNDIKFNSIVLFFPHEINNNTQQNFILWITRKILIIPKTSCMKTFLKSGLIYESIHKLIKYHLTRPNLIPRIEFFIHLSVHGNL